MKAVVILKDKLAPNLRQAMDSFFAEVHFLHSIHDAISFIFMEPPDVIFVEGSFILEEGSHLVGDFKSNTVYGHLPVVAVLTMKELETVAWNEVPLDDFILTTSKAAAVRQRLSFIVARAGRELDTNPLTRLPGNESIIRYSQQLFDEHKDVAIAWVDVDHFKPFNDCYGFSRGDEVLLATARIIANAVKDVKRDPSFVGHIGGDDFIFMCPVREVAALCEDIVTRFDMIIKNFYNEEDLAKGWITSEDRSGNVKQFPIMTISIAVVLNVDGRYAHYGQISRDVSEIKTCLKKLEGSNYMIDRRGRY